MIIDGRQIAQEILDDLKRKVEKLRTNNVRPHLYIITLTTDSASESYVGQKKKKGEEIGAKITIENLDPATSTDSLLGKINKLNNDKSVHGIIVQRPFSPQIDEQKIANSINPEKDVDGFHPESKFDPPISESVLRILEEIYIQTCEVKASLTSQVNFDDWLKSQKIAVIGRGVTAGGPIIKTLIKLGVQPLIVSSQTQSRAEILKSSDIIICAVGKTGTVRGIDIKKGSVLIGVGMFKGKDGKFHSDYEENEIKDIVSFYTPTPGGVGPVNVAQLLSNLIKAAENFFG